MADLLTKLTKIYRFVDSNAPAYKKDLNEIINIESVYTDRKWQGVQKMLKWTETRLKSYGATTQYIDVGSHVLAPGERETKLPPVLMATLCFESKNKWLLLHISVDVSPAEKEDGWRSDPFEVHEEDGRFYGRGISDDKAQLMCWLHAIEAHQRNGVRIPANFKFVVEGVGKLGSPGLAEALYSSRTLFLRNVELAVVTPGKWTFPCVLYGTRGVSRLQLQVAGSRVDLSSGHYGGVVHQAMADLVYLLDEMQKGIPGLNEIVCPVTPAEEQIYNSVHLDVEAYRSSVGAKRLRFRQDKQQVLMHRWRYPALTVHRIEGGYSSMATAIPRMATAHLSLWLVPEQKPPHAADCATRFVEKLLRDRGSANYARLTSDPEASHAPWKADPQASGYMAARRAIRAVHGADADLVCRGAPLPRVQLLDDATAKPVLLMPLWVDKDPFRSPVVDESVCLRSYLDAIKVLATFMHEFAGENVLKRK